MTVEVSELESLYESIREFKQREFPEEDLPVMPEVFIEYCAKLYFSGGFRTPFYSFIKTVLMVTNWQNTKGKLVTIG